VHFAKEQDTVSKYLMCTGRHRDKPEVLGLHFLRGGWKHTKQRYPKQVLLHYWLLVPLESAVNVFKLFILFTLRNRSISQWQSVKVTGKEIMDILVLVTPMLKKKNNKN